jgi:hypothetical protein
MSSSYGRSGRRSGSSSKRSKNSGSSSSDSDRALRPDPTCEICQGGGYTSEQRTRQVPITCYFCNGARTTISHNPLAAGAYRVTCCNKDWNCPYCQARMGFHFRIPCTACGGTGTTGWRTETYHERVACSCWY